MSTPHVADAMISFPSAKLKYGGVRISFLVWWTSTLANEATSNHLAILTVDRSSPPPSAPLVSRPLARRVLFRNYCRTRLFPIFSFSVSFSFSFRENTRETRRDADEARMASRYRLNIYVNTDRPEVIEDWRSIVGERGGEGGNSKKDGPHTSKPYAIPYPYTRASFWPKRLDYCPSTSFDPRTSLVTSYSIFYLQMRFYNNNSNFRIRSILNDWII